MKIYFYNTLTRKKQEFIPINKKKVLMYSCGPTVYNYAHIGNLRAYIFADILEKTLKYSNYKVKRVMNITDIGHLTSDADFGEDKMTKGLLREGKELNLKNMRELAEFYTEKFKEDLIKLNINVPKNMYFASDYVREDILLIQKLEKKGYTYKTKDGIYFNISKMKDYGILWKDKKDKKELKTRIGKNLEKINPEDFALWKFSTQSESTFSGNILGFPSPWGIGFPGWHIECSAMGIKFLGEQFDIHTGGIDHISIHHTNEIAQSESATGKKPFVGFWMHNNFIDTSGEKMAKSGENFLKLSTLIDKKINPIAYRLWILMGHYRSKLNFNWESLNSAEIALKKMQNFYSLLGKKKSKVNKKYKEQFIKYINDDLNTPRALTVLWQLIKDKKISSAGKKATILDFDKVLGLNFEKERKNTAKELKKEILPTIIQSLKKEREQARKDKDFQKSDELRKKINSLGYEVKDTIEGQEISKI